MKSKWKIAYVCAAASIALGLCLMLGCVVLSGWSTEQFPLVFMGTNFPAPTFS